MLKGNKRLAELQQIIGEIFAKAPLSATAWTILSVLAGFCGFISLYFSNLHFAMTFFALSFALDAIDGAVARAKKQESPKGAFLDGMFDRVNEFFLLFGLIFYPFPAFLMPASFWLIIILFFGTCMTAFAKAYAEHTGALSHEKAHKMGGMLERAERAVLLLAAMLVSLFSPICATGIFALAACLSFLTFLERFLQVMLGEKDG